MRAKKISRKAILEHAFKNAPKKQKTDSYFEAVNIQTDRLPIQISLQVTEKFFDEKIIPCLKKSIYKREQKLRDFCLLMANLYYASNKKPLIINLNDNYYNHNKELSRFVIEIKWILEKNKYITVMVGYHDKNKRKRSFKTRIWPTDKLITELFNHPELLNGFQVECDNKLIILREKVKKRGTQERKDLKFRRTRFTNRLTKDLQFINDANRQHAVVLKDAHRPPQILMTDLHAVFNNGTFDYGGRFYTRTKYGYQALYREDRSKIKINGNKTVELDYSGLHPRLLYASVGIQYSKADPYSVVDARPELRDILKLALLTLLNSRSEKQMVQAGNYDLYLNEDHFKVMKEHKFSIKDLLQKFKEVHAPIAGFFCTGEGLKLMNIDSQIARAVLLYFAERGEACLCIHDSFIVEEKNIDLLELVMKKTYQEVTTELFLGATPYYCPVKKS